MNGIRLSKNYGMNPSIVKCFICREDTDALAILGALPGDMQAPKYIINGDICDKCKSRINDGYVAVVEIENNNVDEINIKDVKLAGRSCFVRKAILDNSVDTSKGVIFCSKEFMDDLIKAEGLSKNPKIEENG